MATVGKQDMLQCIARGEIGQATEIFRLLAEQSGNSRWAMNAAMVSGQYARHQRDVLSGIIAHQDARVEEAKIMHALTSYAEELPEDLRVSYRGIVLPPSPPGPSPERTEGPTYPRTMHTGVKKILFLAANPENTTQLRIGQEARDIEHGLERASHRDRFELVTKWAVRAKDLRRALLDESPQIVHFSGHGSGEAGIVLENDQGQPQMVGAVALGNLFRLFSEKIECVLLNACYSESQADEIVRHIPYVIGMNKAVPDPTAIEFAVAFYDALASGRDYNFAYEYAVSAIELQGLSGSLIPVLKKGSAV